MQKTTLIGVLITLLLTTSYSQESNCFRKAIFGNKAICLPEIDGYKECYSDDIVRKLADATEVPTNMVLGFYLNNRTFDKKDSLGLIQFDDYFKIYGTKEIQNYNVDNDFLSQMESTLTQNFMKDNWERMSSDIEKLELNAEIGVPIFVEKNNYNKESFSIIMITKYKIDGMEPYTLAVAVSGYIKNNRMIWMAYYLDYKDSNTITTLKEKSNMILQRLVIAE